MDSRLLQTRHSSIGHAKTTTTTTTRTRRTTTMLNWRLNQHYCVHSRSLKIHHQGPNFNTRASGMCRVGEQGAVLETVRRLFSQSQSKERKGAHLYLDDVTFHPPGAQEPLLKNVGMVLEANNMGLVFGKSGSGKTTLLQLVAGLVEESEGNIWISSDKLGEGEWDSDNFPLPYPPSTRLQHVGMVFQFPERHFLGHDIRTELTFGWPNSLGECQDLLVRVQWAMNAIGLLQFDMTTPTNQLSDGFKRRLALAVQLVRQPSILLLDEPLAGLDWQARADMVQILKNLKQECTLLVVSHDLKEISPLVDSAWQMKEGGELVVADWP